MLQSFKYVLFHTKTDYSRFSLEVTDIEQHTFVETKLVSAKAHLLQQTELLVNIAINKLLHG